MFGYSDSMVDHPGGCVVDIREITEEQLQVPPAALTAGGVAPGGTSSRC